MVAATLPRGLVPPVLPNYLDLSVGGTLSVGGVGASTWRSGVASDHVLELDVVTGRGELVTCAPTATGACSTPCAPASARSGSSSGATLPWSRRRGGSAGSCCPTATCRPCWPTLARWGRSCSPPILRESVQIPLLHLPPDRVCFTFNLFRFPPTDRAVDAQRLVTANRTIYDRVLAAGGALYPVSAVPMSQTDWRTHFGPTFPQLSTAKRAHDPGHVLTPGYGVFSPPLA